MSIGYACIAIGVPDTAISRCSLKNADENRLREIITKNLSALEHIMDYNAIHKIRLFRISSDIIPFGSHPVNQIPWWKDYQDILSGIGRKMKKAGIRGSMHPGQYTVLNSAHAEVVTNARNDLIYHEKFLTALGLEESSKLILHIGGVYGNKSAAMHTFLQNFRRLPEEVKRRLVLENDDKNYTVQEVLSISEQIGVPVVFDNLHHALNPSGGSLSQLQWIRRCGDTWKEKDGRQKIHYSQQKPEASKGSHSDTVVLSAFDDFYRNLPDREMDIMLEVKDKNLSAIKCINGIARHLTVKDLENEWSRYQYYVRSKSNALYQETVILLKQNKLQNAAAFYDRIEEAMGLGEDREAQTDTALLIWNAMRKDCSGAEKKRFEKLLDAYVKGTGSIQPLKNHLLKCASARKLEGLIQSLYFYLDHMEGKQG